MIYIAGGPGGDSIGPAIHNWVAGSLGLDWICEFLRFSDVNDVMTLFRRSDFAGGIVTMPHKRTIIPLLDSVDNFVEDIGACNFVVRKPNDELHGTNTDWLGIKNAIDATGSICTPSKHQTALVYGAGGASRGAVYALAAGLGCKSIYIVNRDEEEVAALMADVDAYKTTRKPQLIHVTSIEQAATLRCPHYVISTVPDFEPQSPAEITCRAMLSHFLERGRDQQNILLDMCYHPPITRNLKAGMEASWTVIPGFLVSGHQFAQQWNLWTGQRIDDQAIFSMCSTLVNERESSKAAAVA
jgi:quinate dehydrogenase